MGNIFAGSEVVELGVQIARNGRDFYEVLVGQSKSEKVREGCQYLAGEEEKDISVFRDI